MSTLQADSQGFLIGKAIDVAKQELQLMRRVADDVRAIRRHLMRDRAQRQKSGDQPAAGAKTGGETRSPSATPAADSRSAVAVATPKSVTAAQPTGVAQRVLASTSSVVALPAMRGAGDAPVTGGARDRVRDERGRFVGGAAGAPAVATPSVKVRLPTPAPTTTAATAGKADRDAKGRFTAGQGGEQASGFAGGLKVLEDIRDGIGGLSAAGVEEVDPSVKAASEVAEVAAGAMSGAKAAFGGLRALGGVIASPVGAMFGAGNANDAPTPWYRRMWRELRAQRREQSMFHRSELRVLKDIEAKPAEGRGGVMGLLFGLLGTLATALGGLGATIGTALVAALAKIPGLAMLGKLLPRVLPTVPGRLGGVAPGLKKPGLWSRAKDRVSGWIKPADSGAQKPGLLQRARGRVGGWVAKTGAMLPDAIKPAGGVARLRAGLGRVPVLGSVLTALGLGAAVYASEAGGGTRAQKDRRTGRAVGRGVGSISGALLLGSTGAKVGAALGVALGPVGIAIGAGLGGIVGAAAGGFFGDKAGEILGDKVGSWVTELRAADIPGKLTAVADAVGSYVRGLADQAGVKIGQAKAAIEDKGIELSTAAKRGYAQATGQQVNYTPAELARLRQNAARDIRRIDQGQAPKQGFTERLAEAAGTGAGKMGRVASGAVKGVREKLGGSSFNGFGADVDLYIAEAAQRYGIAEDVLRGFVKMEGGWTGKMSPTGAIGTGQFIKPTWDTLAKTQEGQQIGMTTIGSRFRTAADPRFDKRTNTLATGLLAKQNADVLRSNGLPVTGENLYMLHNIGPGVLPALRGSNAVPPKTLEAMRLNGMKPGMSAVDFVAFQKQRFNSHYAQANAQEVMTAVRTAPGVAPVVAVPASPQALGAPRAVPVATAHAAPRVGSAASVAASAQQAPRVPDAPAAETVTQRLEKKAETVVVTPSAPLAGRDLPERPIAHIVTGGYATGRA